MAEAAYCTRAYSEVGEYTAITTGTVALLFKISYYSYETRWVLDLANTSYNLKKS